MACCELIRAIDSAFLAKKVGDELDRIDAYPGSPVLDLKPYTPSIERVERPSVPGWRDRWPKSYEEGGGFDWEVEFSF